MFSVYNKSSESMDDVADASVDLIYTSPPYNIGTHYNNNTDNTYLQSYIQSLEKVLSECHRILKEESRLVVEVADTVVSQGTYIQLAGLIQAYCIKLGFSIEQRHINFLHTQDGVELPEDSLNDDYCTQKDAHSNCHQILIFIKKKESLFNPQGQILYINYESTPEHPCPMPLKMRNFVLDSYFSKNMVVADPFMGTASLGRDVLQRGGSFVGYELDAEIFRIAENRLKN